MSVQAMTWVLEHAPGVPPHLVAPLIGVANHADRHGKNAYVSHKTLVVYTRKTERKVRRDLTEMLTLGLIRLGDQRAVEHIRADRRPVVYDLVMDQTTEDDAMHGRAPAPGREEDTGGRTRPGVEPQRGGVHDRAPMSRGGADARSSDSRGGVQDRHGGAYTPPEPKEEPKEQEPGVLRTPGARAPAKPRRSTNAGTRIPEDFAVTPKMVTWARETTPLVGRAETDDFIDYWKAIPGAKGEKRDWVATWRRWMRKAQKDAEDGQRRAQPRKSSTNGYQSPTDANIAAFLSQKTGTHNQPNLYALPGGAE